MSWKKKDVFRYKGVQINKPDNISMNMFKRIVDECGKDNCIAVQSVVNLISKILDNLK